MPVYEYFCRACRTKYDKLRPMADADAPVVCPECGEENSVRALSLFAAHTGSASSADDHIPEAHSHSGCGCGGACACGRHSLN